MGELVSIMEEGNTFTLKNSLDFKKSDSPAKWSRQRMISNTFVDDYSSLTWKFVSAYCLNVDITFTFLQNMQIIV